MHRLNNTIYILLPVHNRVNITRNFIKCLSRQDCQDYHLLLINDGSIDGTVDMVKMHERKLTVLEGAGEWWWAGSLQQGINWLNNNASLNDIVVFMNDDVEFESDFLSKGVLLVESNDGIILARVKNNQTGVIEETGVAASLSKLKFTRATHRDEINCLATRGLFLKKQTLDQIGGFYPILLPHYLSDYEFTIRAKKKGVALRTFEELYLCFDESKTGYHRFGDTSFFVNINKYFSKKSSANPLYLSTFAILVSPVTALPWIIFKIWTRAVWTIVGFGLVSFKLFIKKISRS